ncbi:PREDICTED: RNA-binding protein 44 isoform X2 [Lepidothrix coronata]|uniref:RNA-binding protein 44 isoform X2 n=1 Tax=Lepidothrix coronata TaxID=321398 RepID=A0A6J0IBN0_9PASS|nr:PREDICTED: RNA-binding protein 44 isoform X2 [Lepidothrix coronata]
MEVGKSSHVNRKRSSVTQGSCPGEDPGEGSLLSEDSHLEYLSAHEEYADDTNSSSEFFEERETGEVKDIPQGHKVPPHISTGEEVSGDSNRHTHNVSMKPEGPFLSPRERAPKVAVQFCEHAESSDFYSCEKPGTVRVDSTAEDAETQFPVSEIPTGKSPDFGVEVADESSGGSPRCVNSECRGTPKSMAGVSAVTQAVDASSDFRACFTTSRSSSAQVCLCSRAINTEITMMNKSRPVGWPRQNCVDAASNTEWSFGAHSSHVQEQWESKNQLCTCDWKMSTDRPVHLNKQTVKNSVSSCCQNTLQRATEAELQLLAIHYKMCYQHCLTVYQLAFEENTAFGRCDEKTELHSSLLLVLEELENNYNNMRMEINMGIPLNALPPLSVEVKLPPISSFYVPGEFFRKSLGSDGLTGEEKADVEAPEMQEQTSVNRDKSQTEGGQPSDSASPEAREGQHKGRDLKHGRMKTEEGTEYWFDAKEELTMSDFPVIPEETKKQQEKQGTEAKTVQSGNEHSSVHVGGPSSSVLEDTGENSLQKTSYSYSIEPGDIFNSPYALNLSSFTKLIKRLQATHPEASRDQIVEAIQQVRKNNKGMLCGLAISTIEERTSAILRKSMPNCGQEKQ